MILFDSLTTHLSGLFKVINTRMHNLDDGKVFPFQSSTNLFPEVPVIALNHVHETVTREVQDALEDIEYHAKSLMLHERLLCENTPYLSELAHNASVAGGFARFRTAKSYGRIRTKQEDAGFLFLDQKTNKWECIDEAKLWGALKCPEGQFMVPEEQFKKSCELAGLDCLEGYDCFCQPCIKAFEVDVFQHHTDHTHPNASNGETNHSSFVEGEGCDKMAMCGSVQQTKQITFRAIDNLKRAGAKVDVLMHIGESNFPLSVVTIAPYTYEFTWSYDKVSVVIMEVLFDGAHIPESPFQVHVVERQCDDDNEGKAEPPTNAVLDGCPARIS